MSLEIERKWRVQSTPRDVTDGTAFRQGYLSTDAQGVVRLRDEGGRFRLTFKRGSGKIREEVEIDLTVDQFETLWPMTAGKRVEKTRFEIALGSLTAELDHFTGLLTGLRLVEVEFPSEATADAFVAPDWFGEELTHQPGWSNSELAVHGLPGG